MAIALASRGRNAIHLIRRKPTSDSHRPRPSKSKASSPVPAPSTPAESPLRAELRIQTVCLSVLTVVALGFALWWLKPVLIPFVVAAFLAIAFNPLVDVLEVRSRLSRTLAVCVALLLAFIVLAAMGLVISNAVEQFTNEKNLAEYQSQIHRLVDQLTDSLPLARLGVQREDFVHFCVTSLEDIAQNVLRGVPAAAADVISKSALVLVFLFFLQLSSVKRDHPIGGAWGEMEGRIRGYLITMTALSGATGALVGAVLSIFGIKAAVLFGLLTFLLNFIPNVGSFISILLPVPIIMLAADLSPAQKIMAIGIPAVIQFLIGNFIQPKLMGGHMKLHPVVILIALIFWGMLWGIVGAFLAVPITSTIRIACDRHPLTKPIADLMVGRLDAFREEPPVACEPPA
jgi:AI-2 transport protein TqsA